MLKDQQKVIILSVVAGLFAGLLDTFIDYFTFSNGVGRQIAGAGQYYYPANSNIFITRKNTSRSRTKGTLP